MSPTSLRRKMVTYPNGRKIHTTYGSGGTIADVLNRADMLEADSGSGPDADLVIYSYNGVSRLAKVDYTDNSLDAAIRTSLGRDRFGRTVRQEWQRYHSGSGVRDRFDYEYDYAGNRTNRNARVDLINGAYPDARDQLYAYDGLQRLKTFDEGTLSSGSISGTPTREQDWTLDQLGNWPGFVVKADGTPTLNQTRYHNAVNEIDTDTDHGDADDSITASTGANWIDPKYDEAGNMTHGPKPGAESNQNGKEHRYTYDAWNRLVKVEERTYASGSPGSWSTVQANEYDGLGRRIVRSVYSSGSLSHRVHYYYNGDGIMGQNYFSYR